MHFALYPNVSRDPDFKHTMRLIDAIESNGGTAWISAHGLEQFQYGNLQWGIPDKADFVISLGGDGTFLSSMGVPGLEQIPRIGVNLGSIGFLQEILPEEIETKVSDLFSGNFQIIQRAMFCAECYDLAGKVHARAEALNDVILSRGVSSNIIKVDLYINDSKVEMIPGDGVIVATATGSTAYSLSCGGPIVHPGLDIMLITPICPHTLHNRSYITDRNSTVRLQLVEHSRTATVSVDGRAIIPLQWGGYVDISLSEKHLPYIVFGEDNFYETLAIKIQKRGISQ